MELLILLVFLFKTVEKEIAFDLIGMRLFLLLGRILLLLLIVVDLHGDSLSVYGPYLPLFELVIGNTFLLSFVLILIC